MDGGGERRPCRAALVALVAVIGASTGCGGSSGSATSTTTRAPATASSGASSSAVPSTDATSTDEASTAPPSSTAPGGLTDASVTQHTAPPSGTGVALLHDVRLGRNEGFERIVFEFTGTSVPGYRIEWVDGPIRADASGEVVPVAGAAHLVVVMQPASGFDMDAQAVTYDGPDRVPVAGRTELITDLVRTGDFEAVLSWAAGATHRVPFRVLTLSSPTRIVIDLDTSA